jgi:uncharacterized protein GlcG (DUF336 family)
MLNHVQRTALLLALGLNVGQAVAGCPVIPRGTLAGVANTVVHNKDSGGFGLEMWVTLVDEYGRVCHVVNTSTPLAGQPIGNLSWLGSRVISAQKANTANAFSLDGYAISTGILYSTVQPGGSLFGLQPSNPVDPTTAYAGGVKKYGTPSDPMLGKRPGGINVFGGGLALYNSAKVKIGAIGVSGDTSCTDHVVAWKIRKGLGLDNVPAGFTNSNFDTQGNPLNLGGAKGDEIIINRSGGTSIPASAAAWQHPACPNTPNETQAGGAILLY